MRLQWRTDGRGINILQSFVGLTADGKEIWSDVPAAVKPPKPEKRQTVGSNHMVEGLSHTEDAKPEPTKYEKAISTDGKYTVYATYSDPEPPKRSARQEVVDSLADKLCEYEGESWFKIAEAALEYLEGRMPIVNPPGAETRDYYRALNKIGREVFGRE